MVNTLKPTKEKLRKKKIYGFDIETYGKNNIFLMGSIVGANDEKYIFWDRDEMIKFILGSHKIRNSYLFATNLGFDFMGLFGHDFNLLSKFDFVMRGSDFILINFIESKQGITFLDTMSFYKGGVAKIGKIIGINKLDKPKCLGQKVTRYSIEGQILEQYNINDSLISCKFAEFLQDSFIELGCNLKYTIASTAKHLFTNKYLKEWIIQPPRHYLEFMYKGYYGGRVEAFKRGKIENLFYYDINSLYPYVMSKFKYPHPNSFFIKEEPEIKDINNFEGLTYCKIECENFSKNFIPLLPCRTDNKLIFPVGIFYGFYSNVELRKALELGYKVEPLFSFLYSEVFNPFKDYVEDLYKKRIYYKNQNSSMQLIMKLLLNSLYGKFAQKLNQTHILFRGNEKHEKQLLNCIHENAVLQSKNMKLKYKIESPEEKFIEENGMLVDNARLYYVTDLFNTSYPKFINPILSLYVTSYGRLELYKYFEEIQKTNNNLFYCDTDSIITDKKFETSENLGDLKLEYKITKGIIVKPKFYYFEDRENKEIVKAKGLQNLKTFIDFNKVLKTRKYSYMKFTKFKESVKRKFNFNQKIDVMKIIDIEDNKRSWNGKKFNLNEIQDSSSKIIIQYFED